MRDGSHKHHCEGVLAREDEAMRQASHAVCVRRWARAKPYQRESSWLHIIGERERERERVRSEALHTLCIDLEHVLSERPRYNHRLLHLAVIEQLPAEVVEAVCALLSNKQRRTPRATVRERREEGKEAVDQLENLQDFEDRCDQDGVEDLLAAS